ncbi:MAG TPA: ImmA/IrrE family metallo-endopeptidase, partial [Nitrospirae bacterium]|nr:ImmA/IrrE family metallo-endopeptidase [Nitrospirota bacterium]
KGSDMFWFSFFHEAGHVLYDGKKDLLINDDNKDDPREVRADRFAAEFLIPSRYDALISSFLSKKEVVNLAKELGISPAIVAGRYQHLTKKWHFFKELITPLKWKE